MAAARHPPPPSLALLILLVSSVFLQWSFAASETKILRSSVPLVNGLSYTFYQKTCPNLNSIVRKELRKVFRKDIGLAAALLRIHFHDCFVQGCDGSVLLDGSASGPGEQDAPPNLTLRPEAFVTINKLRALAHRRCGHIVSCSDLAAIAARDAVFLSGGPDYDVPLGRRDGLTFATRQATLDNLPPPSSTADELLKNLASKNFDATDIVALSGGHTIGISHCSSFTDRLYPNQDPTMNTRFAKSLRLTCPTPTSDNTTVLDIRSPFNFDNQYYVDLMKRQGLFTSDQDLYTDRRTRGIVTSFAVDQQLFFGKFVDSMTKMGQLSVLTGEDGEIRANCSVKNADNIYLSTMIEEAEVVLSDI